MAIEGLIGRPGSGKSYELTARALHAADRGRPVFANYAIEHPNVFLFGPDDLLHLPPGLVVIDEAHLWFPARMALKLPMSWLGGMSQTRKKGWDLLYAAQHETRVDRVIRDVTSHMWLVSAWGYSDAHPTVFLSRSWEPENFRQQGKALGFKVRRYRQRVAESYNTHETLQQADHTQDAEDRYAKRAPGSSSKPAAGRRTGSVLERVNQ